MSLQKLIAEKVRQRPFLYDPSTKEYRDAEKRSIAWMEIGGELNLTANAAKESWEKLRRCYINAVNRRKKNKSTIVWRLEREMSFLESVRTSRPPAGSNIKNEFHDEYNTDEQLVEDEMMFENSTDSKDFILMNAPDPFDSQQSDEDHRSNNTDSNKSSVNEEKIMKDCTTMTDEINEDVKLFPIQSLDEVDMYFLSLAQTTKTLPKITQARIKIQIGQIILQEQIGKIAEQLK